MDTDTVFEKLGEFLKDFKKLKQPYVERLKIWRSIEDSIYTRPEKSYQKLLSFREKYGLHQ